MVSKPQTQWNVDTIAIDQLMPNKHQPRVTYDKAELNELGDSLKAVGTVVPIIVRPLSNGHFEIVDGYRRFLEAQDAGAKEVTVLVKTGLDEKGSALEALIANLFRADLDPFELAEALRNIKKLYGLKTNLELGKLLGKSEAAIRTALAFNDVPSQVRKKVSADGLDARKAKELTRLDTEQEQEKAADVVLKNELTDRETQTFVTAIKTAPAPLKKAILENKVDPRAAIEAVKTIKEQATPMSDEKAKFLTQDMIKRKKVRDSDKSFDHDVVKGFIEGDEHTQLRVVQGPDQIKFEKLEHIARILDMNPLLGVRFNIIAKIQHPKLHNDAIKLAQDIIICLTNEIEYDRKHWPLQGKLGVGTE